MKVLLIAAAVLGACVTAGGPLSRGQDPAREALRKALDDELSGAWVYDDLKAGFLEGATTGKPLLLVFR